METTLAPPPATAAVPTVPACEAFLVRIPYIWLMVLLPTAGLVIGLLSLVGQPSGLVLAGAALLLAGGYWAWRRGYQAVRLELRPAAIHVQPESPGQPAQAIPLASIANYLRAQETYYQAAELQLHGRPSLRLSKRLRSPAGLLTLDAWTELLAERLEQTRPVADSSLASSAASAAASVPASGLLATPPRVFARTGWGKLLAGLAGVWLVLAGLAKLGGAHVPGAAFLVPSLYLGYYFRARGVLKVETRVVKGSLNVERDDRHYHD